MIFVALGVAYVGYSVLYFGIEYVCGVPLSITDALFPWRYSELQGAIGAASKIKALKTSPGSAGSPLSNKPLGSNSRPTVNHGPIAPRAPGSGRII